MNGEVKVMNAISLKTEQIKKRFGGVQALSDGSIKVRAGEVLALVGANGSGKSTLTKIITGVLPKDDGTITYEDQIVVDRSNGGGRCGGRYCGAKTCTPWPRIAISRAPSLTVPPRSATGSA